MKRAFIIHGWGGFPEESFFPWLASELQKNGFSVSVPVMPNALAPKMEEWIPFLAEQVGTPDSDTYFVGHSIGCQTIIRYLEMLPEKASIGGAVFVAGWYDLRDLNTAEEKRIAGPWLNTPRNDAKIKAMLAGKAMAIFSDNDPYVDIRNVDHWREKAGARTLVLHKKAHFGEESGVKDLPEALTAVLELAASKTISIDDFAKVHIKMGKILSAERIEGSDKLLKLSIDLGEAAPRTICSGIAQYYQPEEIVGKMVPVITNLAPRKMRGVESNGMVLFGIDETEGGHKPVMLNPLSEVPPGSQVA